MFSPAPFARAAPRNGEPSPGHGTGCWATEGGERGGGGLLGSTGAPPGQPPDPHLSNTRSRPPYGPLGPRIPFWQMSAHTCRGVTAARFCVSSGALRAFRARYAPLQRGKNSRAAARSRQKAPKTAPKCAVPCGAARGGGAPGVAGRSHQPPRTPPRAATRVAGRSHQAPSGPSGKPAGSRRSVRVRGEVRRVRGESPAGSRRSCLATRRGARRPPRDTPSVAAAPDVVTNETPESAAGGVLRKAVFIWGRFCENGGLAF